jgi:hypothetical protein
VGASAGCALAFTAVASSLPARAEPQDPTLHQTLFAPSAAAKVGALELPRSLRLRWQVRIPGTVSLPPTVTADGSLLVASSAGVTELTSDGARRYFRSLGPDGPATAPVVTPDDGRIVVTSDGDLVVLSPKGEIRRRRRLRLLPDTLRDELVVTSTGSLLVGAAGVVLELSSTGEEIDRAELESAPASLIDQRDRRWIVTGAGEVLEWRPPAQPRAVGTFGDPPRGEVRLGANGELVAVLRSGRLVSLDTATGALRVRVAVPGIVPFGTPALLADGTTALLTQDGLLLEHDRHGKELRRVVVAPTNPTWATSRRGPPRSRAVAFLVAADRRALVAWPQRPPVLVEPDGTVVAAPELICPDPSWLVPLPGKSVALVCESGLVARLGDAVTAPEGPGT